MGSDADFWSMMSADNLVAVGVEPSGFDGIRSELIAARLLELVRCASDDNLQDKLKAFASPDLCPSEERKQAVKQLQVLASFSDFGVGSEAIDHAVKSANDSKNKIANSLQTLPLGRRLIDQAKAHSASLRSRAVAAATMTSHLQELDGVMVFLTQPTVSVASRWLGMSAMRSWLSSEFSRSLS